ncbi:MAG: DUF1566 domain-containing protein [Rhodoferax sp.]
MQLLEPVTLPVNLVLSAQSNALLRALLAAEGIAQQASPTEAPSTALQPPAAGEYWQGQGGYYICTLPALLGMPARHLIVSANEKDDLTFGPDKEVSGAGSHIDGAANTTALLKSGDAHPAAHWARTYTADGHNDFFLPSRYDLLMAWLCAPKLFKTSGWYWSSTQFSRHLAFVQDFEDGGSYWLNKGDERRVRASRAIQL